MKKIVVGIFVICFSISAYCQTSIPESSPDQVIFAFGGDINKVFIKYTAALTNLPKPKVCYVPTASADNVYNINFWYDACHDLPLEPYVLRAWPSSGDDRQSFEEILTGMDAIIVGGGNTLNMMAIWKAQGIDTVLQKCLKKGIILAGGSAGSICWFINGVSDSRPKELSMVDGLAFLPFSSCPHYSEWELRKNLYQEKILSGTISPGYACDYYAGILFRNGTYIKAVSLSEKNNSWLISAQNGKIVEKKLKSEIVK
ncbi:MAG: peptidase E [Bacteroidales bacterium]|jgi:peptidase E